MLALSLSSWASLSCATSCSALTLSRSCWSFWQLAALIIPSTTTQASVVRVATTAEACWVVPHHSCTTDSLLELDFLTFSLSAASSSSLRASCSHMPATSRSCATPPCRQVNVAGGGA